MKMLVAAAVLTTALASSALAQTTQRQQHSVNPGFDVYENGRYVGSDPDPNIRLQLQRQHDSGQW
jgi:hypothetical protein